MNWTTIVVASALSFLPLSAYAADFPQEVNNIQEQNNMRHMAQAQHGRRWDRGQKMERLLQQLDLTPEQSQQIEAIQADSETTAQELRQRIQTQHQEMRSLMTSDATTEELRAQYQQAQDLRQQLGDNRFETMLQIREVLTPEQRAEIAELMEQHRGRKGAFFQR
ncbi:MAG: Spy/CpxP family protein refolding chaperone [Pleurocapsa sp. MO_226.B13]|nr:Spy/CpxP family protein refolding chaperone [Pleurocapsa sp. MO_226.B13]